MSRPLVTNKEILIAGILALREVDAVEMNSTDDIIEPDKVGNVDDFLDCVEREAESCKKSTMRGFHKVRLILS